MEPSDESTPPDDVPESEVARRRNANMVYGIVAGMLLGVVVGVVLGNMALWIAIGVGVGVAVGSGVDIESMLGRRPKN